MFSNRPNRPVTHQKYKSETKRNKFVADGYNYHYFDVETRTRKTITKDDLCVLGIILPKRCQEAALDIKEKKRFATYSEHKDFLLLMSLSMSIWHAGPENKLPYVSILEYQTEFYIQMIRALTRDGKSRWSPERAKWAQYARKWVRLDTIKAIAEREMNERILHNAAALESHIVESDTRTNEEFWDDMMNACSIVKDTKEYEERTAKAKRKWAEQKRIEKEKKEQG